MGVEVKKKSFVGYIHPEDIKLLCIGNLDDSLNTKKKVECMFMKEFRSEIIKVRITVEEIN